MPSPQKRIVLAGGSGFLGKHLRTYFENNGCDVVVLSRSPSAGHSVQWDARTQGSWTEQLEGSYALINLAGRTVDCRYTEKNRAAILNSRIESTRALGVALRSCSEPPKFWLNSSTATIYEDTRGNAPANTESAGVIGDDFSMGVAQTWEETFFAFETPQTVKTAIRASIIMGSDGGAFPVMATLARRGLCSPQGCGEQWISWLHVQDFCRAMAFLLENPLPGPVNLCSPYPVQNSEFNALLREQMKPLFVLPQPVWLLQLGALILRTQTELILKSRKVFPDRLIKAGFSFDFPHPNEAIANLSAGVR